MEDRELLELAAKAAGIQGEWGAEGYVEQRQGLIPNGWRRAWAPLSNDGDALQLAVKLQMCVSIHDGHCMACAVTGEVRTVRDTPTANATRRAIVLAAANVGEAMP